MRILCFTGLIVAAVYGAFACSSNAAGPGGGTGGGSGSGTGGAPGGGVVDGGCVDPTQVFNAVDKCLPKAEAVAACKTQATTAQPGTKVDDPTCGAGCTCEQCTEQMLACSNDPDGYCPTILACAQAHKCAGVACYAAGTCMAVIDKSPPCPASGGNCTGIQSNSLGLASAVSDCATKAALFASGMPKARDGSVCAPACP
jgi:hypothetical protein